MRVPLVPARGVVHHVVEPGADALPEGVEILAGLGEERGEAVLIELSAIMAMVRPARWSNRMFRDRACNGRNAVSTSRSRAARRASSRTAAIAAQALVPFSNWPTAAARNGAVGGELEGSLDDATQPALGLGLAVIEAGRHTADDLDRRAYRSHNGGDGPSGAVSAWPSAPSAGFSAGGSHPP